MSMTMLHLQWVQGQGHQPRALLLVVTEQNGELVLSPQHNDGHIPVLSGSLASALRPHITDEEHGCTVVCVAGQAEARVYAGRFGQRSIPFAQPIPGLPSLV